MSANTVTVNRETYEDLYSKGKLFVRYPMDHVIRFHAYFMRSQLPRGRVLDYGCGSGNNSALLLLNGYEVHGVDVAETALSQVGENLKMYGLDQKLLENFQIIDPQSSKLPYKDGFFDMILSNQVLYYLCTERAIRKMCREFDRILRPGGLVFFTMLGARNYYYTHHLAAIHDGETCEIRIQDKSHHLNGLHEMMYIVRDEEQLKHIFSDFEPINIGYFDHSLLDVKSGFHWIFVGRKKH